MPISARDNLSMIVSHKFSTEKLPEDCISIHPGKVRQPTKEEICFEAHLGDPLSSCGYLIGAC